MLNLDTIIILSGCALLIGWIACKLSLIIPNRLIKEYEEECQAMLNNPLKPVTAHRWQLPIMLITALYITWMGTHTYGINIKGFSALFLGYIMLVLSAIDFRTKLLPDWVVYTGMWAGLFINTQSVWASPTASVIGALLGYLIPWLFVRFFLCFGKANTIGYGDCKMLAMLGAWFGPLLLTPIFLVAAAVAFIGRLGAKAFGLCQGKEIAFGPFIALGGLLALHFRPDVFHNVIMTFGRIKS